MAFARVNGVVLHYGVRGAADKPALVFSNALGTDFRIWEKVADRLADSHRLILYDKRGHGLSEAPRPPYTLADHVRDLAALIDRLEVREAAIVGLSVGGMIAQGLAALRPDLVRSLVLCGTAQKIGTDQIWDGRIKTVRESGVAALADGILERWFTPSFRSPDNPDFVGYSAMLTRTTVEGYTGTCAALRDADLTESTRALAVPVLCLAGDRDGSTPPETVRALAALIRNARFEIVADAGHLLCIEQPEAMAARIRSFLRQANGA